MSVFFGVNHARIERTLAFLQSTSSCHTGFSRPLRGVYPGRDSRLRMTPSVLSTGMRPVWPSGVETSICSAGLPIAWLDSE